MRFGSVCSGIEAASVAWGPLGWKAAWLAEIEPFPSAVLAHHYPDVPNLGDMTQLPERIASGEVEAPDVFCGGTPCQAFSVAGLRRSLDDARGNLSLTFCEIANAIDLSRARGDRAPAIVFWENVPGVLNTKDNAFGCFLAGLAGEDGELVAPGGKWPNAGAVYGPQRAVAWRVLDAQYFGVAQRRRRVFVVASARAGFDPAAVLFEFDGLRRDIAPSREAREGVAGGVEIGPGGGRLTDLNPTLDTRAKDGPIRNQLAGAVITMAHGQGGAEVACERSPTLTCNHEAPIAAYALQHAQIGRKDSAGPQGKGWQEEVAFTQDSRSCADAVAVIQPYTLALRGREGMPQLEYRQDGTANALLTPNGGRGGIGVGAIAFHPTQDPISSTDGSTHAMGTGSKGGAATVAVAIRTAQTGSNGWGINTEGTAYTLDSAQQAVGVAAEYYSHDYCHDRIYSADGISPALNCSQDHTIRTAMQVRRLTPTECERLQGFPDGYTSIPWRKKPASECPDGPRYKALGNSWAVPNVRWIGRRIALAVAIAASGGVK